MWINKHLLDYLLVGLHLSIITLFALAKRLGPLEDIKLINREDLETTTKNQNKVFL